MFYCLMGLSIYRIFFKLSDTDMEFWKFGVFHFFYSISHQPFLNRTIQLFAVINRPGSFAQHNNICRHGNLHGSVLKLKIWKCLCAYLPDFSETHCLQIEQC